MRKIGEKELKQFNDAGKKFQTNMILKPKIVLLIIIFAEVSHSLLDNIKALRRYLR